MGGDDQGAAAASNAAAVPMEEGVTEEPQNIDLPLHSTIRTLQLQNGLRHSDYQRYRHYTTRRLRRLRKVSVPSCLLALVYTIDLLIPC